MMKPMKHIGEVVRNRREARRRRGEASWLLVVALLVLFVGGLAAARSLPSWAALLALAGSFALLSVAGWLWGADTRDGSDWKPQRGGAIR
jgi:hypothetical protein